MPDEVAAETGVNRAGDATALSNIFGFTKREIDSLEVLGFLLYEQGRSKDAEAIFAGLVALDPRRHTGPAGLGALALVNNKLDEAVRWLTDAASRNPQDATVHANLGEALLKEGKFDDAAAEFQKALELDPDEKDAGANRARAILAGMKAVVDEIGRNASKS